MAYNSKMYAYRSAINVVNTSINYQPFACCRFYTTNGPYE
jgi:hypothetical protein